MKNTLNNTKVLPIALAISSALSANPSFAQQADNTEVIQVSGIRSSLIESMDLKKNASSIQDSIVAEDIGKFPDQNVAESLQRITGVMIDRTNGEGSKVTVRGFGPKFNAVHLNDRIIATTDVGREFDFQSLPSELISGADVVKASRANISEGSMGAYINVRTARPLDNPGFQAAGSINAKYNDLAEEFDPKISAIVSNTFADDSIGVLFGVSVLDITNRIDSAGANRWAFFDAADTAFALRPYHRRKW
ncbi:TonB-dependent receptor plug domain-containing protein [Paraglaciecola aquimarina]|uniref:TonB-dependent receptor plug domain-containing protein n=1 Tax=Paraglaciecola aquimarina TaxID=1235557 RepID=A0ABU3SY01_9ALTE|nr:TonB-dependent receptor plug domain-containing protein [Paraglaciecola aquimarina]MDU0354889.1 TonB-dependent receptor plug domain-containing protein [Paraglaciecola aquimarina]